jgi:hypothetical protein
MRTTFTQSFLEFLSIAVLTDGYTASAKYRKRSEADLGEAYIRMRLSGPDCRDPRRPRRSESRPAPSTTSGRPTDLLSALRPVPVPGDFNDLRGQIGVTLTRLQQVGTFISVTCPQQVRRNRAGSASEQVVECSTLGLRSVYNLGANFNLHPSRGCSQFGERTWFLTTGRQIVARCEARAARPRSGAVSHAIFSHAIFHFRL